MESIDRYPKQVDLEKTEKIIEQMKKYVCKVCYKDEAKGTGAFCKIPFPNEEKILPILITNNHVIDESILNDKNNKIALSFNNDEKIQVIELKNRISYTNKEYDITFIEIKDNDKINDFLELEENINKTIIVGETIYMLHYPKSGKVSVSYGIVKEKKEEEQYDENYFGHLCSIEDGSSGGPILNLSYSKLMGMHKGADKIGNFNLGLYLTEPINDFFKKETKKIEIQKKVNYTNIRFISGYRRIQREFLLFNNDPIENCSGGPICDNDLYNWQVTIMGPIDSPYCGGIFFINIKYPREYPFRAPQFVMTTRIFHPNVYEKGKICCCVFGQDGNDWNPAWTIREALSAIIESMKNPIVECAAVPYVLDLYKRNRIEFESKAKEWTKKYAL